MYNLSMFKRSENLEVIVQPNGIMVITNNPYEAGEPSPYTITIEIDSDDESCAMWAFEAHLRNIILMDNIQVNALKINMEMDAQAFLDNMPSSAEQAFQGHLDMLLQIGN